MACNIYTQYTSDGTCHLARRSTPQGCKPSGLAEPVLVRLYREDAELLAQLRERLGNLYNGNEIIRNAVASRRSVYIELLKS